MRSGRTGASWAGVYGGPCAKWLYAAVAKTRLNRPSAGNAPVPQQQIRSVVREEIMRIESHSGPLPDPATLGRYEEILPGVAERIIVMAEQQSAHRMRLESQALAAEIARSSAGMWFAGLLAFFGLAAGTTMVLT